MYLILKSLFCIDHFIFSETRLVEIMENYLCKHDAKEVSFTLAFLLSCFSRINSYLRKRASNLLNIKCFKDISV